MCQLPVPPPLANGNYSAGEFLRTSIARDIIRDRVRLGLSQKDLAKLAGVRVETLCRIETGKVTPTIASIEKIDRALERAEKRHGRKSAGRKRDQAGE